MTTKQTKQIKQVNKEIKKLQDRILVVVNDRIFDQLQDDVADEIGGLMSKIEIDFTDNQKLTDYIYEKFYNEIIKKLIKLLLKKQ